MSQSALEEIKDRDRATDIKGIDKQPKRVKTKDKTR